MVSGDEKVEEIMKERPLLNYLSSIITFINRFDKWRDENGRTCATISNT